MLFLIYIFLNRPKAGNRHFSEHSYLASRPFQKSILIGLIFITLPSVLAHASPLFKDETARLQLANFQHNQSSETLSAITESTGSGVCTFDFDGDGWTDIFFVGGSGHRRFYGRKAWWTETAGNRLFKNESGKKFSDVTDTAGLSDSFWGMGCTTVDLDNDGDSDLIVTGYSENRFYENLGNSAFNPRETVLSASSGVWSTCIVPADFDNDGHVDLYLCGYLDYSKGARTFEANTGFRSLMPIAFQSQIYTGVSNRLLRNRGNWEFEDVASKAGVDNSEGRSLDALWSDVNADGLQDLFVVNDTGTRSPLYINRGDGTFSPAPPQYQFSTSLGGHGIAVSDINNDTLPDYIVTSPLGNPPSLYKTVHQSENGGFKLFDINWDSGVARNGSMSLAGWGTLARDFNNDGFVDIFIANGAIASDPDSAFLPIGQPDTLLLNNGNSFFVESALPESYSTLSGRGLASADFDNDGDIDLVINNNNDVPQILLNKQQTTQPANWLQVILQNKHGSQDVFSARVIAHVGERTITRFSNDRHTFLSNSDARLHFGLGITDKIDRLVVTWPDGEESSFSNVSANQVVVAKENMSVLQVAKKSSNPSQSTSNLALIKTNTQRLQWLQTLVTAPLTETAAAHFQELYFHLPDSDRITILKNLLTNKTPFHPILLAPIQNALESEDETQQVAAVSLLKRYELEVGVHWLLNTLQKSGTSPNVACEIARSFEFYFHEEEAVIYRKWLAVAPLTQLLDSTDAKVVNCALRSLAEAERFRGVHRIMDLLDDPRPQVAENAIRTLGLIRDRIATPALSAIAQDTQRPPGEVAAALIALTRLNEPQATHILRQVLSTNAEPNRSLLVASALLHPSDDDVVVDASTITSLIAHQIQNLVANSIDGAKDMDRDKAVAAITILFHVDSQSAIRALSSFTRNTASEVRRYAYQALSQMEIRDPGTLEAGLFDADSGIADMVAELISADYTTPNSEIKKLLTMNRSGIALKLADKHNSAASQIVFETLANLPKAQQEKGYSALSKHCAAFSSVNVSEITGLITRNNFEANVAAIRCTASTSLKIDSSLETQLIQLASKMLNTSDYSQQLAIAQALSSSAHLPLRRLLLEEIKQGKLTNGLVARLLQEGNGTLIGFDQTLLDWSLQQEDPLIRIAAVRQLSARTTDSRVANKLIELLQNPNQIVAVRFAAAQSLYTAKPKEVLDYVYFSQDISNG